MAVKNGYDQLLAELSEQLVSLEQAAQLAEVSTTTLRKLVSWDTDNITETPERGLLSVPEITSAAVSLTIVKHPLFGRAGKFVKAEIERFAQLVKDKRPAPSITHNAMGFYAVDIREVLQKRNIEIPEDMSKDAEKMLTFAVEVVGLPHEKLVTHLRDVRNKKRELEDMKAKEIAALDALLDL